MLNTACAYRILCKCIPMFMYRLITYAKLLEAFICHAIYIKQQQKKRDQHVFLGQSFNNVEITVNIWFRLPYEYL